MTTKHVLSYHSYHMSFVAGFYSLSVELNDVDGNRFAKFRVKTPRHPSETSTHLAARFVAYAHAYTPGLKFSQGLFVSDQPTAWEQDFDGSVLKWLHVGVPDRSLLETALRSQACKEFSMYLYEDDQLLKLTSTMSGSKSAWKSRVSVYMLHPKFIEKVSELEESSASWHITLIDHHLFLSVQGQEFETQVTNVPT